jgi:hypothetical protein
MYFGCATRANRARWLLEVTLLFVAVALIVVYGLEIRTCDVCKVEGGRKMCEPMTDVPHNPLDLEGILACLPLCSLCVWCSLPEPRVPALSC